MSINVSSSSIIHPILFALFPVVFIFGNNTSFLSSTELFEPIILILGIATLIWFILKITVKNPTKTKLIAEKIILKKTMLVYSTVKGVATSSFIKKGTMFFEKSI